MENKVYVINDEFNGAYVGTLKDIQEWCLENRIVPFESDFYELGEKVNIVLKQED